MVDIDIVASIISGARVAVNSGYSLLSGGVNTAVSGAQGVIKETSGYFVPYVAPVQTSVRILDAISGGGASNTINTASGMADNAGGVVNNAVNTVKDAASNIVNVSFEAIITPLNNLKDAIVQKLKDIASGFADMVLSFAHIISSAVSGIADGITKAIQGLLFFVAQQMTFIAMAIAAVGEDLIEALSTLLTINPEDIIKGLQQARATSIK